MLSGIFVTSLKQSMACLFIMVVICVIRMSQIGRILELACAEYVDLYNLDAPEGMELKVLERSKVVDGSVVMVGEVTGSGHVHQTLSSCSHLEADMVYNCKT